MSFTFSRAPRVDGDRWSDVYLSATARAVSNCGDLLAATALMLALQGRGAGGYAVAAILLAAAVPPVLLAPLTGRLVDRVDSRRLLVSVGLAQAAVCVALAFVTAVPLLVALSALLAAGLAVTQPTTSALLPAMVSRASLPRAAALGQTATAIGGLAAPVLGGTLFGLLGLRTPLLLDALSYLAIALLGALLRTRRNASAHPVAVTRAARQTAASRSVHPAISSRRAAPTTPAPAGARQVATTGRDGVTGTRTGGAVPAGAPAGWRLAGDPLLRPLVLLTGAVIGVVSAANVLEVFFLRGVLHTPATTYGLVSGVWLAALLGGAWGLARLRCSDAATGVALLGALALMCASTGAVAAAPAVGWVVPCYLFGGVANGVLNTGVGVLVGGRVPDAARGRAFALVGAAVNGANAAGYLLGGVLLAVLAVRPAVALVGGAGLALCAALAAPTLRAVARERAVALVTRQPEPVGVS